MLPLLSELRREDAVRGPVTGPAASVEGQEAVSASVLEHSCCGRVRFYLSFLIGKMFIKSRQRRPFPLPGLVISSWSEALRGKMHK